MNINNIHKIYFVGIGGIGMSALARFFNEKKCIVFGYDKTQTPLTQKLEQEGMQIHYEERVDFIPKDVDLVVYTPAIPSQHQELVWYKENNYKVVKRSDVLQYISESMQAMCVAGTHGKTTVSTMLAHLMTHTGFGANAFLGGISVNYGVNYWSSDKDHAVIEADEYDRSFLKLNPYISVLTAMDADHLDIYGTVEEMERCYLEYVSKIQHALVYKHGLKRAQEFKAPKAFSYSLQNEAADYYASNIVIKNGAYTFDYNYRGEVLHDVPLNIGGMHNIENCVAAMSVCHLLGMNLDELKSAVAAFQGVKRRFEYIVRDDKKVYIDDYAHHPEELAMLLKSAKSLFRNKKMSVVFQPHLFSRTKDFADDFARSLDMADEIILLDIYPARELPIEGITSQWLLEKISNPNKSLLSKEGVLTWVAASKPELLITAGAGDIDILIPSIKEIMNSQQ